tara:strand:- start:23 stop:412 length:390 start_codon:yes stop_codon:yes gene_type:complete
VNRLFPVFLFFLFFCSNGTSPEIIISNCPADEISAESFNLSWEISAGDADIDYVFIVINKNGEYYSRVYFEKEFNEDIFPFPLANTNKEFSQIIENTDAQQSVTYQVNFSISDEQDRTTENTCEVTFKN